MSSSQAIETIIRERRSVRAYSGQALPAAASTALAAACGALTRGPLGTECRILLLENAWTIWGARYFLAGAASGGPHALTDLGRLLEEMVLRAAGLSLGTCWIGLGFPQAAFAAAMALAPGEVLPAVVAVGVPSGRKTAYGLAARLATGASRRKPWSELFFDGSFRTPLSESAAGARYELALEMVRLAPSAQNRQPWRVVREGPAEHARYHFFRQQPAGLLSSRPDWLRLDIGIAMAHFELTLAEAGVRGRWSADSLPSAADLRLPPRTDYVASWLPGERP